MRDKVPPAGLEPASTDAAQKVTQLTKCESPNRGFRIFTNLTDIADLTYSPEIGDFSARSVRIPTDIPHFSARSVETVRILTDLTDLAENGRNQLDL